MKITPANSLGACGGPTCASFRWASGLALNRLLPEAPQGTLVANLVGAWVIGVAKAHLATAPAILDEWRLLMGTGFCDGLHLSPHSRPTSSACCSRGRVATAGGAVTVNAMGSVGMTLLGDGPVAWASQS